MKIGIIKLCFLLAQLYSSVDGDQRTTTEVSSIQDQRNYHLDWCKKCFNILPPQGADRSETTNNTFVTEDDTAPGENLFRFMECTLLPTREDLYYVMVSRCDNSTTQPKSQQRQLCEGDSRNETPTKLPVVLKTNRHIIFKNIFCAFCHDYKLENLKTRAFYYGYELNLSFTSHDAIEHDIENLTLYADDPNEIMCCTCTPTDLDKCSTLYPNVTKNSSSERLNDSDSIADSSMCNHNVKFGGVGSALNKPETPNLPNFKIFFDFNEDSWFYYTDRGQIIPATIKCPSDQVYVIYIGGCQPVLCPLEMYPYNGQCLLRDVAVADKSLLLFPNGTHQMSFHVIIETPSYHDVQVRTAVQNISATLQMVFNHTMNIAMSVSSSSSGNTSDWRLDINVENVYTTVRDMVDATHLALNNSVELQTDELRIVRVLLTNINETLLNDIRSCSTGVLTFDSQNLTLETNASGEYFVRRVSTLYPIDRVGFTLQLYPTNNTMVTLVQAALCVLQDTYMLHCPEGGAITLSNASYMLQNNTLVNLINGQQYESHEFAIRADGIAFVCYKHLLELEKYLFLFRFYSVEQLATFACLLISIVSLLLVLLTYSLLPQLRNVPGIIVMSLSASMLTMQGLMLLVLLPRGWLCLTVAWLLHWSMLATFLWNSVLAFDLAFTLRSKSLSHTSKGSRGRVLRYYIMLCWLLPLLVVVCLGLMDHYDIYDVGYAAGGQCCIGTRSAILWLVIAPMSFSLLFNCACFFCSFSTMFHTAQLMRKSTTSNQGGSKPVEKRRLHIYIHITLIMGFTWAVGFAAGFAKLEELWIAHTVLNGSQGLYFLISFVLKGRVFIMLRDRFSSFQPFRERTVASPQKNMTLSRETMET